MTRAALALCLLGLLASTPGPAATPAGTAPAAERRSTLPRARVGRGVPGVAVLSRRPLATAEIAVHPSPVVHTAVVPVRPSVATPAGTRARHVPLNTTLGGPATSDARKRVAR